MDAPDRPVRVYKVGGSLFDWPELFDRLTALLQIEAARSLLVSGGGTPADVVRGWDRVHGLGSTRAHRLAIGSLSLGDALLITGLRSAVRVTTRDEAGAAWAARAIPVLNVERFLAAEASAGAEPLPASWDVTSDSIAAWIAARWPAELVLLKSTAPALAREPFVDPCFKNVAAAVQRVEWVNLRTGERGAL